jgi:hypothetical protein
MSAGRISGGASWVQGASHEPSGMGRKARAYRRLAVACVGRELCSTDLMVRAVASSGAVNSPAAFDEAVSMKRHESCACASSSVHHLAELGGRGFSHGYRVRHQALRASRWRSSLSWELPSSVQHLRSIERDVVLCWSQRREPRKLPPRAWFPSGGAVGRFVKRQRHERTGQGSSSRRGAVGQGWALRKQHRRTPRLGSRRS